MPEPKRQRLKKYSREAPENLPPRRITPRSIEIIDIIRHYKFIPTSMIVRLVDGDIRTTERHLQNLYHQGLVTALLSRRVTIRPSSIIILTTNGLWHS